MFIIGSFFILISNIFALYPAEFVRESFNEIEKSISNESNDIKKILLKYGALIILFSIIKGVFMFFMRQTIIVMSRKIEFDLKNQIYQKYQELTLSFYKKNNTGDLMNRITEDVSRVRMYLGPVIMYSINMICLFSLVITKMMNINTTLTLYVLAPLPILVILIYYVSNLIHTNSEKVQKQLSNLTSFAQENFSAINIIKIFRNEEKSLNKFLAEINKYTKYQLNLVSVEAWFFPIMILLIGFSTITTIYIGGLESFNGKITTGNIAEFIIYINMLTWPIASIGWITSLIQRAEASMKRINEFLNIKSEIINNPVNKISKIENIEFKNISIRYKDTKIEALNKINFKINQGNTFGIFGGTGSGKSSIANLICRSYDATQGSILINGIDIKDIDISSLRDIIGYVPQDGYLFSGTIEENIYFGSKKINKEDVINAAEISEITNDVEKFPERYNTIIGERGVQLSGGQKQRVSIARAIYSKPLLFILDDCLSAIDAKKEKKILNNLKQITQNKTTIIISHKTSTFIHADTIIVLEDGKIIEKGSYKELIKQDGFFAKMHKKQIHQNI